MWFLISLGSAYISLRFCSLWEAMIIWQTVFTLALRSSILIPNAGVRVVKPAAFASEFTVQDDLVFASTVSVLLQGANSLSTVNHRWKGVVLEFSEGNGTPGGTDFGLSSAKFFTLGNDIVRCERPSGRGGMYTKGTSADEASLVLDLTSRWIEVTLEEASKVSLPRRGTCVEIHLTGSGICDGGYLLKSWLLEPTLLLLGAHEHLLLEEAMLLQGTMQLVWLLLIGFLFLGPLPFGSVPQLLMTLPWGPMPLSTMLLLLPLPLGPMMVP